MKPNKVVLILSGKYAGRKAVVVKVLGMIKKQLPKRNKF